MKVELQAGAFAPGKPKAEIYLPPGYQAHSTTRYPVLYFSDDQDADVSLYLLGPASTTNRPGRASCRCALIG